MSQNQLFDKLHIVCYTKYREERKVRDMKKAFNILNGDRHWKSGNTDQAYSDYKLLQDKELGDLEEIDQEDEETDD